MINVLHVVTDYPDGVNTVSTKAVKNLVDQTNLHLSNKVLSIVRLSCIGIKIEYGRDGVIIVKIPKLKGGVLNFFLMLIVYSSIKRKVGGSFFNGFDIVHSHKLTIDGLLGMIISFFNKKKLVVSIRGSTDCKWTKKDIIGRFFYRKVFERSVHIFWVSAWAKKQIIDNLNLSSCVFSESLLPNICSVSFEKKIYFEKESNKFVFIGRYDSIDSKGLLKCIKAISNIKNAYLDIYGLYSEKDRIALEASIVKYGAENRIFIKGVIDNFDFRNVLSSYCALLMPSNPETFGISYVEALSNNVPFLGSKYSGISGYFNNAPYAVMVDENDALEIEKIITLFLNRQSEIKIRLREDIEAGKLDFLLDCEIGKSYIEKIKMVH
jgi:glycosyltransferase involved in cell wall biosynthesis